MTNGMCREIAKTAKARTMVIWFVIETTLILSACSGRQPAQNGNSPAPAEPGASTSTPASGTAPAPAPIISDFEITAAWRPKSIVLNTRPVSALDRSPAMKYTVTTKPGVGFITLELTLKKERRSEPNSASIVLIDSSGERHKPMFDFASAQTKYRANGDSIAFDNESGEVGQPLSKRGGKLIAVFEVPPDRTGFKAEIDGSSPIDVAVKPK